MVGMPHNLWYTENASHIGRTVDRLVEVDRDYLTLARVDTLRVRITGEGIGRNWEC